MIPLQPLLIFLLVIAVIAVFIYRKAIVHTLLALIVIAVVVLFVRNSGESTMKSFSITQQIQIVVSTFTQWFKGAQNLYTALNTNGSLHQQFNTLTRAQSLEKIIQTYNGIKAKTQSVPELQLPTAEEVEQFTPEQQQSFYTTLADFFAELPSVSTPANDEIPENATARIRGVFTNDMALTTAQGEVIVYDMDQSLIAVYIRELQIPNGPELGVYMATIEPNNTLQSSDFLFVGPLKSLQGNQLYFVPKTEQNMAYNAVFIYSPVLSQVYAIAPLR